MTEDRDDLLDEQTEDGVDRDETDGGVFSPYYVVEDQRYQCPLGLRGRIRFVIDVAAGQVIAAEVRDDDSSVWRQAEKRGLDHLTDDFLFAELEELACLLDEDPDFDYVDVSPFNFRRELPPWATRPSTRR